MFQKPIFCLQEDNLHGDISWFQEPIFVFHGGKSCPQGDNSVLCDCYVPETHLLSPRRQSPWRHLLVPGSQLLAPRNLAPWRQLLVPWRQLLVQREHFFTLREQMFCQKKFLMTTCYSPKWSLKKIGRKFNFKKVILSGKYYCCSRISAQSPQFCVL